MKRDAKVINTFGFAFARAIMDGKDQMIENKIEQMTAQFPLNEVRNYAIIRNKLTRSLRDFGHTGTFKILEHLADEFDLPELDRVLGDMGPYISNNPLTDIEIEKGVREFKQIAIGKM